MFRIGDKVKINFNNLSKLGHCISLNREKYEGKIFTIKERDEKGEDAGKLLWYVENMNYNFFAHELELIKPLKAPTLKSIMEKRNAVQI